MRILYLKKKTTEDEKAIKQALEQLGHKVTFDHEDGFNLNQTAFYDLILFHHIYSHRVLQRIEEAKIPKICWCFDLVTHPDYLPERMKKRWEWARRITEIVDLGFCTDGDWAKTYPDKIFRLVQGCQMLHRGTPSKKLRCDILFAASLSDQPREDLHRDLEDWFFWNDVKLLEGKKDRLYGKEFANQLASSRITVAPDTPIKPNYWSNRVYMVSGYGGFLLHPYIPELAKHYQDQEEIVFYRDRNELRQLIEYYLSSSQERERILQGAMKRTEQEHTYTHRCKELIEKVEEVLL